jgi:sigma-B regulation protein RsbU (phosphoserine phosphatase)
MMPVMDGLELCDIVKKDEELKIIYYIILTARGSLRDKIKGLDVGADDFLLKPIENQELLARIRAGVRIYNLQNELREIEHSKAVVEMACTIGHELNNPLSSLVISIHNLEDELKSVKKDGNFDEDFKAIDESIERIKSLATHLRNLNNPEVIDYTHLNKMIKINKK